MIFLFLSASISVSVDKNRCSYVLLHFVKSTCLSNANPFSTLFSANIQNYCPILFCTCPRYLPAGQAFRFSFQKQQHLHFQGNWPLAPSSFERICYSYRFILQKERNRQTKSDLEPSFWLGLVGLPQVCMMCIFVLQKNKMKISMQSMIRNHFTVFCKKNINFCKHLLKLFYMLSLDLRPPFVLPFFL